MICQNLWESAVFREPTWGITGHAGIILSAHFVPFGLELYFWDRFGIPRDICGGILGPRIPFRGLQEMKHLTPSRRENPMLLGNYLWENYLYEGIIRIMVNKTEIRVDKFIDELISVKTNVTREVQISKNR